MRLEALSDNSPYAGAIIPARCTRTISDNSPYAGAVIQAA